MHKLVLGLAAAFALAGAAQAQAPYGAAGQVYGDGPGHGGPNYGGQTEASVWTSPSGERVTGYSDGEGNAVWRDEHGHTVTGHTNGQGDTVWRDQDGRVSASHTGSTGDSSYKDASGRIVHCKSYGYGRKLCR